MLHTDVINLREIYIPMCLIVERLHTDVLSLEEVTYLCV
jgi:hypothetical protein